MIAVGRKKKIKGDDDPEDLLFSLSQALLFIFKESLAPTFSKCSFWLLIPNEGKLSSILRFQHL